MLKKSFIFFLLLYLNYSFSQTKFLRKYFKQEFYSHFLVGFSLYDTQNKKFIFQQNADTYFIPASNTKNFTLFQSYEKRKDSIISLKYFERKDTLYITGTGDPTFLHPKINNRKVIDFLKNQNKPIVLYYQKLAQNYGNGWSIDDYFQAYSAEISSFPIYGNVITIDNNKVTPDYFTPYVTFNSKIENRLLDKNIFTYKENTTLAFKTSDTLTQKLLEKEIGKKIHLTNTNVFLNNINVRNLKTIPYETVLEEMQKKSNNFFAEHLQMLNCENNELEKCNCQTNRDSLLVKILGKKNRARWEDGSGSSRYNLFTPNQNIVVLNHLYTANNFDELKDYFAINGQYGSLINDLKDEKPFIYAKTGSFGNTYNLSGFLLADSGKIYIFSFMNNHFMVKNSEVKLKVFELLKKIKEKY